MKAITEGGGWFSLMLVIVAVAWLVIAAIFWNRKSANLLGWLHLLVGLFLTMVFELPVEAPPPESGPPPGLLATKLHLWLRDGGPFIVVAWIVIGALVVGVTVLVRRGRRNTLSGSR